MTTVGLSRCKGAACTRAPASRSLPQPNSEVCTLKCARSSLVCARSPCSCARRRRTTLSVLARERACGEWIGMAGSWSHGMPAAAPPPPPPPRPPPSAGMQGAPHVGGRFHDFGSDRDHACAGQRGTPAPLWAGRDGLGLDRTSRRPTCCKPGHASLPDTCSAWRRDSSRLGSPLLSTCSAWSACSVTAPRMVIVASKKIGEEQPHGAGRPLIIAAALAPAPPAAFFSARKAVCRTSALPAQCSPQVGSGP